jgi:hypothetical protein
MFKFSCSITNMFSFLTVREKQNTVARLPIPVQNANRKQKSGLDGDMQCSSLDSDMKGRGNPRICNPDGIRLRGVSELRTCLSLRISASRLLIFFLASMYRVIFKFVTFNAMQSSCFDTVRDLFDIFWAHTRFVSAYPRSCNQKRTW